MSRRSRSRIERAVRAATLRSLMESEWPSEHPATPAPPAALTVENLDRAVALTMARLRSADPTDP